MKDKKVFGSFIKQKRLEKHYSQKELADLLFVTESAVSKWERGITYPDITLIKSICEVLEITEHELIESSDDTEYRKIKKEAVQFGKIKKGTLLAFNICYAIAILTCFIVNLAVNHTLSWFFIVVASVVCAYTFVPTITWLFKKYKSLIFIGSTFISLFLLFLTCSIYTKDYWFMIATFGVLLGYFIITYPIFFTKQKKYISEEKYKTISKYFLLTYSIGILIIIYLLLVVINSYHKFNLGLGFIIAGGCLMIPILFGILKSLSVPNKIFKIIVYSLLFIFIAFTIFTSISTINAISNKEIKTYNIDESYNNININLTDYNLNLYISETGDNKVIYEQSKKVLIDVKVENDVLLISQIDNRKIYEKIFNFGKTLELNLYLSAQEIKILNIKGTTGDIKINKGSSFDEVNIDITTGDIEVESSIKNNLCINNSTGDIKIKNSNVVGNIKIKTTTGFTEVLNVNCNKLDILKSTGATKLINTTVVTDFIFEGTTGDVIFDGFDAFNISISVSTGDVKGTLLTSKFFVVKTTTGDIRVPETREGGICRITTTTGNITISYK